MTKRQENQQRACDRFIEHTARIDAMLERLQAASAGHFETNPDDRMFGDTRVVSNPRGYPLRTGAFECKGYDDQGMIIEV